jgi:hypothetical protein
MYEKLSDEERQKLWAEIIDGCTTALKKYCLIEQPEMLITIIAKDVIAHVFSPGLSEHARVKVIAEILNVEVGNGNPLLLQ